MGSHENQKNALKYSLLPSQTGPVGPEVSASAQGSYLVKQPHEEHGQAGVEHVVERDEPVLVRGLWGEDRGHVTNQHALPAQSTRIPLSRSRQGPGCVRPLPEPHPVERAESKSAPQKQTCLPA